MTAVLMRSPPSLEKLIALLFERVHTIDLGAMEGRVMTVGPPPYRRVDCDGRALAYVRPRPKRSAVRVDVSGLWAADLPSPIRMPTANGSACLLVRTAEDVEEAVVFLRECVSRTRRRGLRRAGPNIKF